MEVPSALYEAGIKDAAAHGSRAVLRMAADADRAAAEALDLVMPILRLHVEERAGRKAGAIDELG